MNHNHWWDNPAYCLAALGWSSLFGLSWLLVLGQVAGPPALAMWVFFLFVAAGASAMGSPRRS